MIEAKLDKWINLLMNVVLCFVMGLAGQIVNGQFDLLAFIQMYLMTLCIGFTVGTWLPAGAIGMKLAQMLGCKEGIANYIVSNTCIGVIMTTVMTFAVTFIQAGVHFFPVFCALFPIFVVVATSSVLLTSGLIINLAKKIAGIN